MKKAIAACLVFSLSCPIGLVTANDEVPRRIAQQNQGTEKWTVRDADGKQIYVLERPQEAGRHRNLGMVTGLLAGLFFGGYAAGHMASDADQALLMWSTFVVGGALTGYAAFGGFSKNAEVALADGRRAVQENERRLAGIATPEVIVSPVVVPELRLASVAGFDELDEISETPVEVPVSFAMLR